MCSPKDKYKVQEQHIIKNKKAVQKKILNFYKTKKKECARTQHEIVCGL